MNWFIKNRGKGKTTALIYTSATTGYPIITNTRRQAELIKSRARDMELNIPDPIVFEKDCCLRLCLHGQRVLIDEAKPLIRRALEQMLGCEVAAVTLSAED